MSENEPCHCQNCVVDWPGSYRYCPDCGQELLPRPPSPECYQSLLAARDARQQQRDRFVLGLWWNAWVRLVALGGLLLALPDAILLAIFFDRVQLSAWHVAQFLLVDAAVGMLVVLLLLAYGQRGVMGDLLLLALRLGQMPLLFTSDLSPFTDGVLSMMTLVLLPLVVVGVSALLLDLHLSNLLDAVARTAAANALPPAAPSTDNN